MDIEDIKGALNRALQLRPPKWDPREPSPPREKVAKLEDYLLESAYAAAELEESLHWLNSLVAHFTAKVEQITGYEVALPRKPRDRITQADINTAKRTVDPVTFDAGAEVRQLIESTRRQIERLRFEEQWVISRAYSMISGS